ncbi:hypothetical protein Nmel_003714 [Mimus melanotis]
MEAKFHQFYQHFSLILFLPPAQSSFNELKKRRERYCHPRRRQNPCRTTSSSLEYPSQKNPLSGCKTTREILQKLHSCCVLMYMYHV